MKKNRERNTVPFDAVPPSAEARSHTAVFAPYPYRQPTGTVRVQDYLLTELNGRWCLLLRWVKEADMPLDGLTFELSELDAAGAVLATRRVAWVDFDLPETEVGRPFLPEQGIAVSEQCRSVRIQLSEVVSGAYVYRYRPGRPMTVAYRGEEPWVYDGRAGEKEGLSDTVDQQVCTKLGRRVRFTRLLALLTVLLLLLVILFPYLPRNEGNEYRVAAALLAEHRSVTEGGLYDDHGCL